MTKMMGPRWVDFHCHLDLYPDHASLIRQCDEADIATLAVTTTPKAWPRNREMAAQSRLVRVALGLHPQLVAERGAEVALFERYLPEARYIGEIGLDAGPRFYRSLQEQEQVLDRMLRASAEQGRKVASLHSVRSVAKVLTALEATRFIDTSKAVLHWFTGTQAEARRAVEMGCYFSINSEMLRTERHRTLVASLPPEILLTETDGPFVETPLGAVHPRDVKGTVVQLAEVFGVTAEDMRSGLISNLRELLS